MNLFLINVSGCSLEPYEPHFWARWTIFLLVFQTGHLNQMKHILAGISDWQFEPDESHSCWCLRLATWTRWNTFLLVFETRPLEPDEPLVGISDWPLEPDEPLVDVSDWPPEPDEPISRSYFRLATWTRWTNFSLVLQAGHQNQMNQFLVGVLDWPPEPDEPIYCCCFLDWQPEPDEPISRCFFRLATRTR